MPLICVHNAQVAFQSTGPHEFLTPLPPIKGGSQQKLKLGPNNLKALVKADINKWVNEVKLTYNVKPFSAGMIITIKADVSKLGEKTISGDNLVTKYTEISLNLTVQAPANNPQAGPDQNMSPGPYTVIFQKSKTNKNRHSLVS